MSKKYWDSDKAQEVLTGALEEESYLVYDPEEFVEDGHIHGFVLMPDGHVITFLTEPEWGPVLPSATHQGIAIEDNDDWVTPSGPYVELYKENKDSD